MAYTFTVARMSIIGYIVGTLVYRLYFSPLSKIPGSKLAAATLWYEFYYDVILGGQYTFKIKELHQKHGSNHVHWGHGMLSFNVRTDSSVGPIIRISPYEVHIDDPEYYHTLYSHRCPRDKCDYHVKPFNLPKSSFGTESARVHRLRRVNRSYRYLEASDWHPHWGQTLKDASKLSVITKQVAWTLPIPKCFPQSWAKALNPGLALFFDLTQRTHRRILEVLKEREQERGVSGPGRRKTLIDQLLDSKLPQEEKSMERLAAEIRSAIGAGTETTSNSMTYHLLANPQKLQRLRDELLKLGPGREANLCELEQLPYLSSCILEGLRCVSAARRGKHLRRRCAEITSPGYPTALVPASNANQTTQRSYTKHIEFLPGLLLG
ncbi:cytochrome P450 [Coccidioides immitis RMSCC 3703]|uniref:Cytochrome P450 n=2 Tax=Coccidioides immitis TaxID=5501 RepID=A0A0J8U4R4_COCIT|nr:cytochrome P450 [Coccidioides immitis RMSCC 2394]KMU81887.1 cytochrome P450 [Coccidioides immitis RMSCC 3703]